MGEKYLDMNDFLDDAVHWHFDEFVSENDLFRGHLESEMETDLK
jgi:hypothetical protein